MVATSKIPGATAKDQLKAAQEKLAYFESKVYPPTDPRITGMWKSRIRTLEAQVVIEAEAEIKAKSQVEIRMKERIEPSPARSKSKGSMYCLCGCGKANNPGARFQQGHDARIKSKLRDLEAGIIKVEDLPMIVRNVLEDPGQTYFKRCNQCNSPFLGLGEVGPVCSGSTLFRK